MTKTAPKNTNPTPKRVKEQSFEDKLDEILGEMYGLPMFHAPKTREKLMELQKMVRKSALLSLIESEIIGSDEDSSYLDQYAPEKDCIDSTNNLRASQRAILRGKSK